MTTPESGVERGSTVDLPYDAAEMRGWVIHQSWLALLAAGAACVPEGASEQPAATSGVTIVPSSLRLNDRGYFEGPGLNVMAFSDHHPDAHQTGVTVIQHGRRVAANGDVRLEVSPGQWSPVPKLERREVDRSAGEVRQTLSYPDESKNRTGFNPIDYPELELTYTVRVAALEGSRFRVTVDLETPLPDEWVGQVGFNLELFPPDYFGKAWMMGDATGVFTRQPNGPLKRVAGRTLTAPLATGPTLVVGLGDPMVRMKIEAVDGDLTLWDGRSNHNNGWFIVRTPLKRGATKGAVQWVVTPHTVEGWMAEPTIQVSQLGYASTQPKRVVIERDPRDRRSSDVVVYRLTGGETEVASRGPAKEWGRLLRFEYLTYDFTAVTKPGVYRVAFGGRTTHPFRISDDVFSRGAWQPVLEYYLPVQMCHMRVEEKYRVWHGLDHEDDARLAPVGLNHFDGYVQGPTTLVDGSPGDVVPGLNVGGWHDAGDYDLRIESQMGTVWMLAKMVEEFGLDHDATTIDHAEKRTRIHEPDGKNDAIQQIEHGLSSVLGAYRSMGRLYRGIIVPTLSQYVLLGDAASQTDGVSGAPTTEPDDRWVFTEDNPDRELVVAAQLAAAGRVLAPTNPRLSKEAIAVAVELTRRARGRSNSTFSAVFARAELYRATGEPRYVKELVEMKDRIIADVQEVGWVVAMVLDAISNSSFTTDVAAAVAEFQKNVDVRIASNPYGVPYTPGYWGAGWDIQRFGVEQYFLHKAWPTSVRRDTIVNALNFVLGVHPGRNTTSFASGVGANSALIAYGTNRADWSFIPGGVIAGTAVVGPDLPELREWPFFWQQREYVMGGGATHYMFLALAAAHYFAPPPKMPPGEPRVETLAQFPAGTFLENLVADDDGAIFVTSYFAKQVLKVDPTGKSSVFAELDDHPVAILSTEDGFVLSAMAQPFTEAPAFMQSNVIVFLSAKGDVVRRVAAPRARFLNGLHRLDSGEVVAADSVAGTIWKVETSGALTSWFSDPLLTPVADQQRFRPGANGVKSYGGALYVSNSSRGAIYRRASIDSGPLELFAKTGSVDDFVIDTDGTLFVTTHREQLLRVSPAGQVSVVLSKGCGGCTSVVFSKDRRRLVVANDGGLFYGGEGRARLFTVQNFR